MAHCHVRGPPTTERILSNESLISVTVDSMMHFLAGIPGNAVSALLIGSQLAHCLLTGSVPLIGGAILRSERPGFYSLVVALLSAISGLQVSSIHLW